MKYTALRNVRVAINASGTETAWLFAGEEYSETSTPPLLQSVAEGLEREGIVVRSSELGLGPPEEEELETALDVPTVTAAVCGSVMKSGKVCEERKPCRYHDRKQRS